MEEDCLNKDVVASDKSLKLVHRTWNFLPYQQYNITTVDPNNRRVQYDKGQKRREYYWENKINPVIEGSNGSEICFNHYIIYEY